MDVNTSVDRRFLILIILHCITIIAVCYALFRNQGEHLERTEVLQSSAAKLLAAGIRGEAISQYEEYLRESNIPRPIRASVSYSIAELYEAEGRPEKALAWYYQVTGIDSSSTQVKESQKKIVSILESLGRHQAAKAMLSSATSLDPEPVKGTVVAEVSQKKILLEEIDATLDSLPKPLKSAFEGVEGKRKFVKKYVADQLLFEKAKRQNFDTDPKWLKQLEEIKRQYLVGRVVDEEIISKINMDETDLKNYYEAHKAKYTQNKTTQSFDKVKQLVSEDYRLEKSQKKYQELIDRLVDSDQVKLSLEKVK